MQLMIAYSKMLKLFKQGIALQLVVILVMIVVLWAGAFVDPVSMPRPEAYGPIYDMVYGWISDMPVVSTIIAIVLVVGEAFWFNELLYSKGMVSQNTLMPMFLYVLLMSIDGSQHTLTPVLMVNLLVVISMHQLLQTGQPNITVSKVADVAFLVSVASLCYLPAAALLIPLMAMMPTYKMYRWNDWMALLLGLIGPYLMWGIICFMSGSIAVQPQLMWQSLSDIRLDVYGSNLEYVTTSVLVLLSVVFMIGGLSHTSRGTTAYRNNVRVLELPMLAGLVILAYTSVIPIDFGWFAFGITFAATTFFDEAKKRMWIYDSLLLALLVTTILTIVL